MLTECGLSESQVKARLQLLDKKWKLIQFEPKELNEAKSELQKVFLRGRADPKFAEVLGTVIEKVKKANAKKHQSDDGNGH